MSETSIHAVRYGSHVTTRGDFYLSWSSYGEPDSALDMAYYFWVIRDGAGGPVTVVDTGFSEAEAARRGRSMDYPPARALHDLGIDPAAVPRVVITHLHYDHAGNLALFPNAEFVLARREFDFWTGDPIARRPLFAQHTDPAAIALLCRANTDGRVRLFDDTLDLDGNIRLLRLGGHTPGQTVVSVQGGEQPVLLASDAVHFHEELAKDRPPRVLSNLGEYYCGFDTLVDLSTRGYRVVPGHDPAISAQYPAVGAAAPIVRLA